MQWTEWALASLSRRPQIPSATSPPLIRQYIRWALGNWQMDWYQFLAPDRAVSKNNHWKTKTDLNLVQFIPLNGICAWHISLCNSTVRQMSTQHENKTFHNSGKWVCQWQTDFLEYLMTHLHWGTSTAGPKYRPWYDKDSHWWKS